MPWSKFPRIQRELDAMKMLVQKKHPKGRRRASEVIVEGSYFPTKAGLNDRFSAKSIVSFYGTVLKTMVFYVLTVQNILPALVPHSLLFLTFPQAAATQPGTARSVASGGPAAF